MPKKAPPPEPGPPTRKSQVDAILLKYPGVVGKKLNHLDAYFVSDRMFACISGNGLGLRLPVAVARELQFSRGNVSSFSPGGVASTQEWIQIERENAEDYAQDADLFAQSIAFVKGGGR